MQRRREEVGKHKTVQAYNTVQYKNHAGVEVYMSREGVAYKSRSLCIVHSTSSSREEIDYNRIRV